MTVRLIIKTIMRHPAVTLAIIGYNHPGHTFHSKQVVVLLLSPEIVPMIVLDAYSGLLTSAVLCFTNFVVPNFFIGLSRALPVYRARSNLQFNMYTWLGLTFAPLVCFTLKKVQRHSDEKQAFPFKERSIPFLSDTALSFRFAPRDVLFHAGPIRRASPEERKVTRESRELKWMIKT